LVEKLAQIVLKVALRIALRRECDEISLLCETETA
jgi:hypothetical protein